MSKVARTRSDVDIRSGAKSSASILDRIPADCPVEILEDLNGWFKVKPARMVHGVSGYLPEAALTFPPVEKAPVFPELSTAEGTKLGTSVHPTVKLTTFLQWLIAGGKPEWILERVWSELSKAQQTELIEKIRTATSGNQPLWDSWIGGNKTNARLDEVVMLEWIVMMEGGREVYAIRDHYVYIDPLKNISYFGCALKGQVMRWTGSVRVSDKDGKRRSYYEVDFYRMSRYLHGWFRADIVADYLYPSSELDPTIEANALTVFDLKKPILRHPQDQAIADSKLKGYNAAQYVDIFPASGKHIVHYSLCGEFCVATLSGKDILPTLKKWLESKYWRAASILNNPHEGTSAADLQTLLTANGLKGELYSSIPTTPQIIKDRLASGQYAIVGCGINSGGKVKADGRIRHWVVLEDIIPSGNSGWVRVYNPFQNREEVYNYTTFIASSGVGAGLWIIPAA